MGINTAQKISRASGSGSDEGLHAEWSERAAAIYEELRSPATGMIRRAYGSTLSDQEIEDAYSGAWVGTLRALEHRHERMSDEEIRSYVLTAVANQAGKEIRRRRRKPVAPLEAARSVPEVADGPDDVAASKETAAVTKDVLSSLPPRRRRVMLMRYGWGLEPAEICERVRGLSARAYRKEITKGVDAITKRMRLVEDGRWCDDREQVLKAYAAGVASEEEALQAQSHMAHCRSCSEFVGRLTGHLHDVGSAMVVPAALDGMDGHEGLFARLRDAADSVRDVTSGFWTRTDASETAGLLTGARGAGAAGAGVAAKVSGMSGGGKTALACLGGGFAATACVAGGIATFNLDGLSSGPPDRRITDAVHLDRSDLQDIRDSIPSQVGQNGPGPSQTGSDGSQQPEAESQPEPTQSPVLDPSTPPQNQELGEESVAAPVGTPPTQTDSGSSSGAVAEEFGP